MIYIGNGKDAGKVSGRIVESDMHDVGRFLNRLLGLPPEIQNRFVFDCYITIRYYDTTDWLWHRSG